MPDTNLEGKVAIVTGAGGRLGRRVARRLAAQGATLAAVDLEQSSVALPEGAMGRVFFIDALKEEQVEEGFRAIERQLGPASVLVHTVGGWSSSPLLETSLGDFERLVRLNLSSTFLCFREAARQMRGSSGGGGGRLIGVASGQGADGGAAEQYAYSASKAGVVRLVEAAAAELRGTGITAHAIAPSTILFGEDGGSRKGVPAERLVDLMLYLCGPAGEALNGDTLRAYGTAR